MINFLNLTKKFASDERGAAIVEYGLALLVVAGIAITALNALGSQTNTNIKSACTALGITC